MCNLRPDFIPEAIIHHHHHQEAIKFHDTTPRPISPKYMSHRSSSMLKSMVKSMVKSVVVGMERENGEKYGEKNGGRASLKSIHGTSYLAGAGIRCMMHQPSVIFRWRFSPILIV